jgi:uncharacterized protein YcfL
MKYIVLLLALSLVLVGCATPVPIAAKFPQVPVLITEKCPQLNSIEGNTTTLSAITKTVTVNYTTYYECAVKIDSWIEWYNAQKIIFENAGK